MKAILEFNLPEDKDDHFYAVHGVEYWSALWDIDQRIRDTLKHQDITDETERCLEGIRGLIPSLETDLRA